VAMTNNGTMVCDACANDFMIGDNFHIKAACDIVVMPWKLPGTTGKSEYYHEICYLNMVYKTTKISTPTAGPVTVVGVDYIKDLLVKLGSIEQNEIYKFMYNALGCRVF
jgi:hypothetical protein